MILAREFNRSHLARESGKCPRRASLRHHPPVTPDLVSGWSKPCLYNVLYSLLPTIKDFTISTSGKQPPTIVQFGANSPLELARASSLVAPYVNGVDLNCGCPQSWACAETLGAALMERRELVRDMVVETRQRLKEEGWAVGKEKDKDSSAGRSVSVKIRVHHDLR